MVDGKKTTGGNGAFKDERWKPVSLMGVLATVFLLILLLGLDDLLIEVSDWIDSLGPWAPAVFVMVCIVAVVAAFPGSILAMAAGALFGTVMGIVLVSFATTAGAGVAFLLGRRFARDATERWLENNDRFRLLEIMTEEHGETIVALVRLVPLFPFNLVNYGFGLTKVDFGKYVFWSWLCMLPYTVVYVLGADIFVRGISEGEVSWALLALLLVLCSALFIATRKARRALREIQSKLEGQEPE